LRNSSLRCPSSLTTDRNVSIPPSPQRHYAILEWSLTKLKESYPTPSSKATYCNLNVPSSSSPTSQNGHPKLDDQPNERAFKLGVQHVLAPLYNQTVKYYQVYIYSRKFGRSDTLELAFSSAQYLSSFPRACDNLI